MQQYWKKYSKNTLDKWIPIEYFVINYLIVYK